MLMRRWQTRWGIDCKDVFVNTQGFLGVKCRFSRGSTTTEFSMCGHRKSWILCSVSSGAAIWRFQLFLAHPHVFRKKKKKHMVSHLHIKASKLVRYGSLILSAAACFRSPTSNQSYASHKRQQDFWEKNNLFTGVDFDFQLMDFVRERSVPSKSGTNNIHRPTAGMAPTKKGWQKTTSGIRDNDNVVILSMSDIYKLY